MDGSLRSLDQQHGRRPSLLKNFGPKQNWLMVQCAASGANRDAIGERAYVYVGGRRLSGEIQTGSSFLSQSDSRLHYGLAADIRY